MEFHLRDFQEQDFNVLWAIDQQCFAPGIAYSQRELAIYIRRRGSFTVVAEDRNGPHSVTSSSKIAGFIIAEANRRTGHVISIDVLPGNRRSGLGSQLLREAEDRLQMAGCRTVVLETAVDNGGAISFYKRHGYSILKVVPRYYSNGIDALLLEKKLQSPPASGKSA